MNGRLYTRTGDSGQTSLVGGVRVPKNSPRVEAYGTIDEASSTIGLARTALEVAEDDEARLDRMLEFAQNRLFDCSSRLATPPDRTRASAPSPDADDVTRLESFIDQLAEDTPAAGGFVLPGGSEPAARLHVARTVVRRAERRILDLADQEPVDAAIIVFVNRLSDLLFAAARYMNALHGTDEELWASDR